MVFAAVSMVSSFEADDNTHDLVGVGEKIKTKTKQNKQQLYASLRHIFDAARSKMKAERGEIVQHICFIQTEKKRSGSYLVVSTHTLGPVHLRRGSGGTSSVRHVRLLL